VKVAELLERRRQNWQELEGLCDRMGRINAPSASEMTRFAALYRAACADLALADSYQLPPNTVQYLDRLVGRAHNQLYRTRKFDTRKWGRLLLFEAPQIIFNDRCVQGMFCLFWGVFILSAVLAMNKATWPNYAESLLGEEHLTQMETMYDRPMSGRDAGTNSEMTGFYVYHNAGIGLKCFAYGALVIPGIFTTLFNAAVLGATFGYMARPDVAQSVNFFNFVTAHGPFELTAIVLAAGGGLRIGVSWIRTCGWTRGASLRMTARQAVPIMFASVILFCLAALIEGFVSPSALPYWCKASVAVVSSGVLMFYFVLLGFPRR
jgi:uncharacterized membrane protein SpoIIM required for sporulation